MRLLPGDEVPNNPPLDPAKFNAEELDALYNKDKNPLWLVLKSTKPIDHSFSAEQKIKTYETIARALKNKEIGETDKYLNALNLAKAAIAVAGDNPELIKLTNSLFGHESIIGMGIIGKVIEETKQRSNETKEQQSKAATGANKHFNN